MHPQLREAAEEFERAAIRVRELADRYDADRWNARPAGGGWSATECIRHLNLTSEKYLQLLPPAIDQARALGGTPPARFRRDLVGWLLWKAVSPKGRMKTKTGRGFDPGATSDHLNRDEELADFARLQGEQIRLLETADGLPIHRVRMGSPFNDKVKYSLYSCFTILPAHQLRHIDQAERAIGGSP